MTEWHETKDENERLRGALREGIRRVEILLLPAFSFIDVSQVITKQATEEWLKEAKAALEDSQETEA